MWSPNSKKVLYTDRKNRIVEVDVNSKSKKTVMQNPEGEFYSVNYSPDSQWITYTKSGKNNMSVVYVYHLTSGKEYPVTENGMTLHHPVSALTANISFLLPSAISTPSIARQNGIMLTTVWGEYILLYSPKIPHLLSCHRTKNQHRR